MKHFISSRKKIFFEVEKAKVLDQGNYCPRGKEEREKKFCTLAKKKQGMSQKGNWLLSALIKKKKKEKMADLSDGNYEEKNVMLTRRVLINDGGLLLFWVIKYY